MEPRPVQLEDLIAQVISLEPDGTSSAHLSDAVSTAAHLTELADQLIEHFVNEARRTGASWTEIGRHIGVSKQAAAISASCRRTPTTSTSWLAVD
jgi:hypothetical protein